MKQSIIFAIVALLAVAPAMAGKNAIPLDPPSDDWSKDWGIAQTTEQGSTQFFQVRADTRLPDGTKLVVAIELEDRDGGRNWYDIAIMEVQLGTASMLIDSREDVSVAFPVSFILGVQVRRLNGHVCLTGSFE